MLEFTELALPAHLWELIRICQMRHNRYSGRAPEDQEHRLDRLVAEGSQIVSLRSEGRYGIRFVSSPSRA